MKKTFYNKYGELHRKNSARKTDGTLNLNISGTDPAKVAAECGLYLYKNEKCCQNAKPGDLVFDEKTGTCTRAEVALTEEEIADREERDLQMQFEQEQFEKEEQEREEKFKAWKADKEAEKQAKKEKKK